MSNISKLEFPALNISGENYMFRTTNVKRHLKSMDLLETIQEDNNCSKQDNARADVFIHLKNKFGHLRDVLLPTSRDDWKSLRFQDFKRVNDYTSALYRICSKLEFCGYPKTEKEKLEKTFSTFHASNKNLQTHYRLQNFRRHSDLNALLLVAEKNDELLMKNQQSRPTGSLAIPEANVAHKNSHKNSGHKWEQGRGRDRGHFDKRDFNDRNHSFKWNTNSYGRGHGRGRGCSQRANNYHVPQNNNSNQHNKWNEAGRSENNDTSCFRCGSTNHWAKACRTTPHLCELYQASLKGKEKEVNHVDNFDDLNAKLSIAYFDVEL